ncbi:MAG: N-acetylmuramic acid 6-phosphate etherase, partial [Clostridiales bacterium]|nr:N-acetylmuramic acid 6-phosphate etherase [Clostridiales bacterium]
MINLNKIDTERPNPASAKIDQENTAGILSIINSQDQLVALAVGKVLGDVAEAVDVITEKLSL